MKGLLRKDFDLLKGQKQFFGSIAIIMFIFIFAYDNFYFVISYMTIMFSILVITTMSYDDYENGMCYLMSLPVGRKEYVKEKYTFSVLSIFTGLVFVIAFVIAASVVKDTPLVFGEILSSAGASILIAALSVGITVPVQLKFGAEKSKLALMGVFGAGFLGVYAVVKLCEAAEIDINPFLNMLFVDDLTAAIGGILAVSVVIMAASYLISVQIMRKKEF